MHIGVTISDRNLSPHRSTTDPLPTWVTPQRSAPTTSEWHYVRLIDVAGSAAGQPRDRPCGRRVGRDVRVRGTPPVRAHLAGELPGDPGTREGVRRSGVAAGARFDGRRRPPAGRPASRTRPATAGPDGPAVAA